MALCIGFFEAIVYVWTGIYGDVATIGAVNCVLIVAQLTMAAALVTMLDEILSNGYGIGSAISLFIATNVCEEVVWKAFSPMSLGNEYEGALINFVYLLISKSNKLSAIQQAFYRDFAPNINNLLATVFVFLLVNFFQVIYQLSLLKLFHFINFRLSDFLLIFQFSKKFKKLIKN